MANAFSPEDIDKIAELANLELSDEEKQAFAAQFQDILAHFQTIQEAALPAELEDVRPDDQQHMREDEPRQAGLDPKSFSSHIEAGHFKVPKVIE